MRRYQQIHDDLKQDILNQKLKQGQRLPSILALCETYQCSKGTIIKALDLLCSQHIIFSKPQSGYYVADNLIREVKKGTDIFLDTGNPVVDSFSATDMKACLNLATELYGKYSLNLTLRGVDSANAILVSYLADIGVYAKEKNIHLIQGITQMLTLLTLSPFPNKKSKILIEEPSYSHYINYLKSINADVLTIPRDAAGIDLKVLETYFKHEDIKFFYTIPRNHNPLGTCYTYKQRQKIMELALKYDVYIVEDDYFGDAHKLPKYVPIHFFSYQKNCIYLRSFSKELPFIRVGMVVVPDDFLKTFEDISAQSYYYSYHMPALISQATLEAYIKSKIYVKHRSKTNQSIKRKLRLVQAILKNRPSEFVTLIGGDSGYYFSLKLHDDISVDEVIKQLALKNIFTMSNERAFYHQAHFDNSMRLSISQTSESTLEKTLIYLLDVIEKLGKGV